MLVVRSVLNCKPGKVRDLVAKFKAVNEVLNELGLGKFRLSTDVAGDAFWTLVVEREFETMASIEETEAKVMADKRVQAAMDGYHDLVVSGRRNVYKLEA
jgi:hypothetical protein